MGGFLGIGRSEGEKQGSRDLQNIFNYGLPTGQAREATGTATLASAKGPLDQAQDYFSRLLTRGRTQAMQDTAPAISAAKDAETATRRAEGNLGTGRTGGTAALNREASANTQRTIDDIINQNLSVGQATGAAGLEKVAGEKAAIGGEELVNALALLGLGEQSGASLLGNATSKGASQSEAWSRIISALI